jgi:hypothetical protein
MSALVEQLQTHISLGALSPARRGRELFAAALIALILVLGATGRWERATARQLSPRGSFPRAAARP